MGKNHVGGLRVAVVGLVIIALNTLALQAVRMFEVLNFAEFAYIGVMILAWIIIFLGTNSIRKYSPCFRRVNFLSMIMIIIVIIEVFLALRNYKNNMGNQIFIDFSVMFMNYLTILGMFYAYYKLLQGVAFLAKQNQGIKTALKCEKKGIGSFVIIIFCYILIPVSGMFSIYTEYIATSVLGLIALGIQLNLCMLLLAGFDVLRGRKKE